MTLTEAIRSLVEAKGIQILTSPMVLNILSDYNAFNDFPSSKNILKNVISEGYIEKIASVYNRQLPLGDAPLAYLSELHNKWGFRKDVVVYVLAAIFNALNMDYNLETEDEQNVECPHKSIDDTYSSALNNHIKFHGISLGNRREDICKELERKGFYVTDKTPKLIELKGNYLDMEDVEVRLFGRTNGFVGDVSVIINHTIFCLYQIDEERLISLFTKKYGEPVNAIRNYYDCESFNDWLIFKKIDDSKTEALDYKWIVPGGYIHLTNVIGNLRIDFVDDLNSVANQQETEQIYLDSI